MLDRFEHLGRDSQARTREHERLRTMHEPSGTDEWMVPERRVRVVVEGAVAAAVVGLSYELRVPIVDGGVPEKQEECGGIQAKTLWF